MALAGLRTVFGSGLMVVAVLLAGSLAPPAASAAERSMRVTLDPGHGGSQIGASYRFGDGEVLQEKTLTLRLAMRVADLLRQAGYTVHLTRTADSLVAPAGVDVNGDGQVSLADDLQARVDAANAASSDLLVSMHLNGSSDPAMRGTYTFWNPNRPFAERSRALAGSLQASLVAALRGAGYVSADRGIRTDTSLLGGDAFFLLGPAGGVITRPSRMPAVIAEPLFLTNADDAAALRDPRVFEALAQGYAQGIREFVAPARAVAQAALVTPPAAVPAAPVPPAAPAGPAARPGPASPPPSLPQQAWTVWVVTYLDTPKGEQYSLAAARALQARGLPVEVLTTAQHPSLRPGYRVVSSGRFESRAAATAHAQRVREAGYADAVARALPAN